MHHANSNLTIDTSSDILIRLTPFYYFQWCYLGVPRNQGDNIFRILVIIHCYHVNSFAHNSFNCSTRTKGKRTSYLREIRYIHKQWEAFTTCICFFNFWSYPKIREIITTKHLKTISKGSNEKKSEKYQFNFHGNTL